MALVATSFLRVSQRQIMGHSPGLPSAKRTVAMMAMLLDPAGRAAPPARPRGKRDS